MSTRHKGNKNPTSEPIKRGSERKCPFCGDTFTTNRKDQKFCSRAHREQYHTERIRQALKQFGASVEK